jgi:iron complex outermembrane receptor protein
LVAAAPATAQGQTTPAPYGQQATPPAADEPQRIEDVVVTGSRIRRSAEFTSAQPLQVITADQMELRGTVDAAAALHASSLAAGAFQINDQLTGYVTAGGGGAQTISLRGLGEQRTLLLLNGRRAGPAGSRGQIQAFDLNVIPQSQVSRVDILKDGASSLYGSDAVAGVINIITSRELDGGSVNFYTALPFESGGEVFRVDGTWGQTFDRGYLSLSGDYVETRALLRGDRSDTGCAADFVYDPETGERLDYVDPRTGGYKCYDLPNGYISTISPSANYVPISRYGSAYDYNVPGNNSPYAGYARFNRSGYPGTYPYTPTDSALNAASSVISPAQRTTVTLLGGYQLTPNAEVYTELLFNRRDSRQYNAAQVFQSFAQRNTIDGAPNYLPASNPNNTLGVAARTFAEYESNSRQRIDYSRAVIGVRGEFALAGRAFDYDVWGQSSLSDAVYDHGPRIYLDRLLAVNSPDVACTNNPLGGNVSGFDCSALPQGVPWMSDRLLLGQFNQAERDFLFFEEEGTSTYEHTYVEGILSTDNLFSLPAGPVGAAFGFHVRHEEIDDQPGAQAANRNVALFTTAGRTRGEDRIREVFAEFELPLLADLPFAHSLDLNVSGRLSDYDSYGASQTYRVTGNWALNPQFRLRASAGTSFRAPALYELYLGNQTGFSSQSGVDPCIDYDNSGVGSDIAAACAALGIPGDYLAVGASSATIFTNGGKGILEAETAFTQNYGVVWTPSFAQLQVAVDYFEAKIDDEVRRFGSYNIIEQCLLGQTDFCGLFDRDPDTFAIRTVNNSYVNVAEQNKRGIDLTINYQRDLGFADLRLSSQNSWSLEDHAILLGGAEEDILGTTFGYGGPAYAGNLDLSLSRGPFTFFYGVQAIGRGSDYSQDGVNAVEPYARYADLLNGIDSADCSAPNNYCVQQKYFTEFTSYHTASMRYQVNGWSFQAGINNLFDERPPTQSVGAFRVGSATLNGYDMRGRRAFFRIGRTF